MISSEKTINFSFDTFLCFLGFGRHVGIISIKNKNSGTSLVVQWLRLHLPMQRVWAGSLVRELRSHVSQNRNNIITNPIKIKKNKNSITDFKKECNHSIGKRQTKCHPQKDECGWI